MTIDQIRDDKNVILQVKDLKMHFPIVKGFLRRTVGYVKAVDKVNLFIRRRETLGLVGESGCGKTTTGRCIIRAYKPTAGEILYRNLKDKIVDLFSMPENEMKPYRAEIRMIFQDPYSSLNPRMTLLQIVGDPLTVRENLHGKDLEERVAGLLKRVGLRPEYMRRYPHAFSGGERQRIGIARSLALNPRVVLADEAVSALDVSVRAQILNLLEDLQHEFDLTYLFAVPRPDPVDVQMVPPGVQGATKTDGLHRVPVVQVNCVLVIVHVEAELRDAAVRMAKMAGL